MKHIDLLQEALTRLEAGEPLETVAKNLPVEEAELLQLAATMRATQPARAASEVQAQRQALLKAAQAKPASAPPARPTWFLPVIFSGAALTVALFAFISLVVLGGLWWWNTRGNENVARNSTNEAVAAVPLTPSTARLNAVKGVVQVQASDGTWKPARAGDVVEAGQSIRTGAFSSATLAFYDGSHARLAPESELRVEALDAQTAGPRTIRLTQSMGDSTHTVAKSTAENSVYEVNTPSGAGRAKGTEFRVSVTALVIYFTVTEGVVEVGNVNVTVVVVAGYTTVIPIGLPPTPPALTSSGEGEVQEVGTDIWRIANQNMAVTDNTQIIGAPQVGDWAAFEGRVLADGSRVADRIVLLERRLTNTFSFIGTVEAIAPEAWTISGRAVRVDAITQIQPGLQVSDTVKVQGGLAADGTFWAASIARFETSTGEAFSLMGVVQSISDTVWAVSGFTFTVDVSTTIEAGIGVGDVVSVQGEVLADGTRRALSITKLNAEVGTFDFVGIVVSRDPWNVSGVPLQTDEATRIDDDIRVGNRVRVRGRLLADGTYLAREIEQLDNGARHAIQFTARVQSINPWVVGGITVTVDSKTKIDDDIEVGDMVTVKGNLLPDGTVLAKKITRVRTSAGCTTLAAIVVGVTGNTLTLLDGQTVTLDDSLTLTGTPTVASVIIITVCVSEDGQLMIISVVVVFQLDTLPPTPTPLPTPSGDKVTLCHKPDHKNGGKTISVDSAAVSAHLAHGDTFGPCGGQDNGGDDDDDDD